ncbi:MAG TPA: hypothetical protein VNB06_20620 [Thermoanaerobaculia bacterium]|nr:hypothetical protein [Thermoanaerobaculia bacterium]
MNYRSIPTTLLVAVGLLVGATGPGLAQLDRQALAASHRADVLEIEALLADPEGHERAGAVRTLVALASMYRVLPYEVRSLLDRAASDADPAIATIATEALYRNQTQQLDQLEPGPVETLESLLAAELAPLAGLLADPEGGERAGAARTLVAWASQYGVLPYEVQSLLQEASQDEDPEVAGPVAAFLAYRAGPPTAVERPTHLSPEGAADFVEMLAAARDPEPAVRFLALAQLRDFPVPASEEAALIDAFEVALSDSEPTISSFAGFALAGLAGDPAALAQVHVGPVTATPRSGDAQPAVSASASAGPQPGSYTTAGVFVGITAPADPTGEPQPISVDLGGWQYEGYVDEADVFIGTAPTVESVHDAQQQP